MARTVCLKTHSDRRKLTSDTLFFSQLPLRELFTFLPSSTTAVLSGERPLIATIQPTKEKTTSAKQFDCFDDYENVVLECHKCHWKSTFEQGSVEYYAELIDSSCPNCNYFDAPMLAIVSYPTLEEARAHSDRPGIRE
jgi:hypothetical protein